MPGLNQLKKFSADILQMGNEPDRRRMKGESPIRVTFPENASEADDSSQFVLGLPQEGDFTSETAGSTSSAAAAADDEEIDIDALLANALGEQAAKDAAAAGAAQAPDSVPAQDLGAAPVEDLSASELPSLDDDIFGDISNLGSSDGTLDALADFEADTSGLFTDPAIDDLTAPEPLPAEEPAPVAGLDSLEPVADMPDFASAVADAASTAGFEDFSFDAEDVANADAVGETGGLDALEDFDQPEEPAQSAINDEFAITDDTQFMDLNTDLPESMKEGPAAADDPFAGMGELDFGGSDTPAAEEAAPAEAVEEPVAEPVAEPEGFELDSIPEIPDVGGEDFALDSVPDIPAPAADDAEEIADFAPIGFDDAPADEAAPAEDAGGFDLESIDSPASLEDVPVEDFALAEDAGGADAAPAPAASDDFSMPDFDLGGDGSSSSDGFDLPPVDGIDVMDMGDSGASSGDSGFGSSDDDFSIPGFSDFDMIPQDVGTAKQESKTAKKQKDEPPPLKTELTDYEYNIFLENLDYYPLNVRLALQDMIVKNEFTDDAVMDVIHKVIKKIPARQLAGHLEKLLDISLPVPANYEKRTAAEYEAYKQSLAYQLRNKIIPIAIASLFSLLVCILFGWLIAKFVVTPVKAEMLYKEGYELISQQEYPQSEQKFNQAVAYKPKKKWYFTYARSYRDAQQYDRSANIYQRLINRFDHDLTASLEYANMELYDCSNYEVAEDIIKHDILIYHIDDPQGMLLLGDLYLEWAGNSVHTSTDPKEIQKDIDDKYSKALYAYEDLMHVHGQTDLHLSRMLRYYMRTDQIPKVLELKSYFYPKLKKKPTQVMANQDKVELAGYMLDKLYGELSPKEEYLRAYIEDVLDLLKIAVESCEKTKDEESYPEAVYNYGRYFVATSNPEQAIRVLNIAIDLMKNAPKQSHARTLRTINSYRLVGELYGKDKKFQEAETMYAKGLTLYEYEKENNALQPDENVGLLYADLADIDYFLSAKYGDALRNYTNAINNLNDTPSIRYRVGWIQYANGNYSEALGSFIKVVTDKPSEKNALLALGNTLAFRNSTSAAAGYYEKLLDELELEIQRADVSLKRVQDIDQEDLFTLYMRATNNLGVALSQVASQTSDSRMNARAITQFSNSIQAYDALTRNPETYTRIPGSNLAEMNLKYLTVPGASYDPEYYPDLPRVLEGEYMLKQADE